MQECVVQNVLRWKQHGWLPYFSSVRFPIIVTPAARGINHLKRPPYAVIMLEINVSLPGILDYTTLSR